MTNPPDFHALLRKKSRANTDPACTNNSPSSAALVGSTLHAKPSQVHAGRVAPLHGAPRGHQEELLPGQPAARPQLSSPGFVIHWRWTWAGQGICSGQPRTWERREHIHNPFPKVADSSPAIPQQYEGCQHFASLSTHGPEPTPT